MPTTVAPNGSPNSFFINEVRRILRDQAAWFTDSLPTDGTNGVTSTAGSKPYRMQRAPIVTSGVALTAPSSLNAGITSYTPVYDIAGVAPLAPTIVDGGAGGTLAAGTYQLYLSYVYAGGESGPGLLSTPLTIAVNHLITATYPAVVPTGVLSVRAYLLPTSAAASIGGYLGFQDVIPVAGRTFNAAGNGVAPVLIMTDTGEIVFPAAPISGTLSLTYQSFRYADQQVLDALTEGLKSLWPEIWQENTDTSLTPAPYLYEYTLPAVFNDPRVQILMVEIRDPNIFIMPYKEVDRYTRPSLNVLFLADLAYSPAGNIRITYNAPYGALSDVEVQTMHLPVYFAVGRLLADQEAMRSRQDELVPLTGEGSSQSGVAQQTSAYWFALYEREKARFARYIPSASTKYFRHWSYSR